MTYPPVFIVGVNGSGTTMLADALGRHPELFMLPTESRVLPYFAERYADALLASPQARRELAQALGGSRAFRRSNPNRGQPLRLKDPEKLPPKFADIVAATYMALARPAGKIRWGDKSPMYLQHLEVLAARFPEARFVHIYRDARDAAQSFHRRWRQNPRRAVYRWKQAIRIGRQQSARLGPGRYMEVGYEDLTADAEDWMRRICEFLALGFHPAVMESSMRMMDPASRSASQGRIIQNSGRWRDYFTPAQVAELEHIAGAALKELGYEVEEAGDYNPSSNRLAYWRGMDRVNLVLHHLRTSGLNAMLFHRVRDSFRQGASNKF
jgi:hypothetical protein